MRTLVGSCFVACFLVACGGSVGSSSNPGGASSSDPSDPNASKDPTKTTTPATLGLEGSYDVTFRVVTATVGNIPGEAPDPPSRTIALRLDLKRDSSGKLLGAIAARWGEIASVDVTEKSDALELAGSTAVNKVVSVASGITDTWKTWRLPRNADGTLTGTFDAKGEELFGEGDVMYQATLGGSGTFTADQTHPETRMRTVSQLAPAGKLLPWDRIVVDLAEPIDRAAALKAARVEDGNGATLGVVWDDPGEHVSDWAGVSGLNGYAASWPQTAKWSGSVGAVDDRVALGSVPSASPLEVLTVGPKAQEIGFDDDVVLATMWGTTTLLGGGFAGSTDTHCEAGGCLRIDQPPVNSCDASTRAGMAARLTRGANAKVAVRYRVLVHPTTAVGGAAPPFGPQTTVQVATEGGAVKSHVLPVGTSSPGSVALEKLATPIDQFEWATPWSTFEAEAPPGTGDLGVAIGTPGSPYCGGPPFPEADVTVLIESVKSL